jgi:BirA family biotin operon repressor/biotin-[acetyl-CoA-carboxylase] ligase
MKIWTHKNFIIHQFGSLNSTNSHAFELANLRQISHGEIILADQQSQGRGRQNRNWISPLGNLYFSLVLQPKIAAQKIPQISFLAIVALGQAVEKLVGMSNLINFKWPNDLLIGQKKVAGLLLESKIAQQNCEFVIVGIGVNIDSKPENTIFPAASLKDFSAEILPEILPEISAENLLKNFLDEFEKIYQNWLDFGFENIRKIWLKKAYRLGKKISIKPDQKQLEGVFLDLDLDGNLLLKIEEEILKISAGDLANYFSKP